MNEIIIKLVEASKEKINMLNKSVIRYFILSMLAGIYVGLGIVLIFSIGAPLKAAGVPYVKALMGASFAIALSLVVFAGSELFTGNNMTMTIGSLAKKVTWVETIKVWVISFIGNLVGSLLLAYAMSASGLVTKGPLHDFIVAAASDKMNTPFIQLFIRGILCNMLVCLAIWTATKAKEDTAKLMLIFWCLFGFIGSGFEHSVANMTLLGMSLFVNHDGMVSWWGFISNLVPVTLGNMVGGGFFIGAAYWFISGNIKIDK